MSGAVHPAGPWKAARSHFTREDGAQADFWDIRASDGRYILAIPPVGMGSEEHEAFARLIAAAPDLLAAHLAWEAAEDARNDCTDYDDGCDNEGPWEQCPLCSARFGEAIDLRHAAIAKAKGGAL